MASVVRPVPDLALPHVWRGEDMERVATTWASGHEALDAQLPGGGWPVGPLIEILQQQPTQHVWRLLIPALARGCAGKSGPVVLVDPPHLPFGPALRGQGLPAERLLCIETDQQRARLWATEQALRCADVIAVLAWLPRARQDDLRRMHLAAQQHDKFFVVFREATVRDQSTPARLRLLVEGCDRLEVRLLKRRGPPLLAPLLLQAWPPQLERLLGLKRQRRSTPIVAPASRDPSHALDRTAALSG